MDLAWLAKSYRRERDHYGEYRGGDNNVRSYLELLLATIFVPAFLDIREDKSKAHGKCCQQQSYCNKHETDGHHHFDCAGGAYVEHAPKAMSMLRKMQILG